MLWVKREPELPPGVLFAIDGVPHGRAELEQSLGQPARFRTYRKAEQAVLAFARRRLLAQEAQERGISVPELLQSFPEPASVRAPDIETYYRTHIETYRHPRRVVFAYAAVARRHGGDPWRRIRIVRTRAQLHPDPKHLPLWIPEGLAGAVVGETGPHPCGHELATAAEAPPPSVIRAACALESGQLSLPVAVEDAVYVVKPLAFEPARHLPLELVRSGIREILEQQAREQARIAALENLQRRRDLVISSQAIRALVEVEAAPDSSEPIPPAPPNTPGRGKKRP